MIMDGYDTSVKYLSVLIYSEAFRLPDVDQGNVQKAKLECNYKGLYLEGVLGHEKR